MRHVTEVSLTQVVKLLEGLFFLTLGLLSIPFIWQALQQYQAKDSSFKRAEVPVGVEFPTFSFCFHPPNGYKNSNDKLPFHDYVLGKNFNISYYANSTWFTITSEGTKFNNISAETLQVQYVQTYFVCYKINSTAPEWRGNARGIKINFEPWVPKAELPRIVEFYLSSEHNVYTITFGKRMNGKVLKYVSTLGKWSGMGIKAEKFIYLKETSNCTDKSFWEIWEPFYANYHGFEKCPRKCAAISLPNNRY